MTPIHPALFATAAALLLAAPALAFAPNDPPASDLPVVGLAISDPLVGVVLTSGAQAGRLHFVVEHVGAVVAAGLSVRGAGDEIHVVDTLSPGRNLLVDQALAAGTRTATLRAPFTTGITQFDIADCPDGVLEVEMRTRAEGTSFGLVVLPPRCG